jgi:membrane-bound lytic murein transglycosylase D
MLVNSNRPVNFLLISISLIVAGCAEAPKTTPLSYNDKLPINYAQNKNKDLPKLDGRTKTANNHKDTVWERLLSLYSLPEINNERVERQLNWYLNHPSYIARIQQRAEPYLHLILNEIEANNIPGELALLPVVESAFIPDAYSSADASGLWQFIPDTGKLYGLEQNSWYDGRRDILDSTQAATAFLKDLGETFSGDWNLALASYNYGKGNIWKAMERNESMSLPTDYWSLDLPRETEDYVPRLLAIAKLFANADDYGIHLNNIPNKPFVEVVDIDSPLDLQKAAQLASMPLDKFMKLNPGFNRASTSPNGPHRLLIPVEKVAMFKTSLAQLPFEDRVDETQLAIEQEERVRHEQQKLAQREIKLASQSAIPGKYKVKAGESLTFIAAKNHTTVQALLKANPNAGKNVRSGEVLKMPTGKKAESVQLAANKTAKNVAKPIQLASAKNTLSLSSNKSSGLSKVALVSSKKSADKKLINLVAQLPSSKSQNYRKASLIVAKASDKTVRTSKKLKRT